MDFMLEHWKERDELDQVGLQPTNGLALSAVLREHADKQSHDDDDYTAFAIHTGHVGDVSRRLHTTNHAAHVVARLNNLEWVFDKSDRTRFERSSELAAAVRRISNTWKSVEVGGVEAAVQVLLGLERTPAWSSRAIDDVVLCQVPLSEFSAGTNGLLFLRWMLHAILPYPTFLWSEHWVGARLRIEPASLRGILDGESTLARDLACCQYKGILAGFSGPRWWRGGIEQFAWTLRAAGAREPEAFHDRLQELAGTDLPRLEMSSPVVCIDRELAPTGELQSMEDVVRLVPDLWPAYAATAYATVASVKDDPELAAIIHPLDREHIVSTDDEGDEE